MPICPNCKVEMEKREIKKIDTSFEPEFGKCYQFYRCIICDLEIRQDFKIVNLGKSNSHINPSLRLKET